MARCGLHVICDCEGLQVNDCKLGANPGIRQQSTSDTLAS